MKAKNVPFPEIKLRRQLEEKYRETFITLAKKVRGNTLEEIAREFEILLKNSALYCVNLTGCIILNGHWCTKYRKTLSRQKKEKIKRPPAVGVEKFCIPNSSKENFFLRYGMKPKSIVGELARCEIYVVEF